LNVSCCPPACVGQADIAAIKQLKAGEWFSEDAVTRALVALAAIYQQDGYYQVKLDPKYEEVAGRSENEGGIVIVPNIVEGPRAVITAITFDLGPNATIRESDLRGIMRSKQLTPPAPYVPAHLFYDRQALPSYYESQGFLDHKLQIVPEFNPPALRPSRRPSRARASSSADHGRGQRSGVA
jgi:outer membrane protein assembly factor BamA